MLFPCNINIRYLFYGRVSWNMSELDGSGLAKLVLLLTIDWATIVPEGGWICCRYIMTCSWSRVQRVKSKLELSVWESSQWQHGRRKQGDDLCCFCVYCHFWSLFEKFASILAWRRLRFEIFTVFAPCLIFLHEFHRRKKNYLKLNISSVFPQV